MYCVGLTGPIASGKSTVAQLFSDLGVTLIDADHIAKQITAKGTPALGQIIAHFGPRFLDASGELNRRLLRDTIFQNSHARRWLEQLLHPMIRQEIEEQLATPPQLYYMIEIPLLSNRTAYPYLNRVLLVLTEPSLQMQRITQRDQHSISEASAIMQAQVDEQTYRAVADDLILNHGSLSDLKKAVLQLHQTYLDKADTL